MSQPGVVAEASDSSLSPADARYLADEGVFLFSGMQALVRLIFDKHRRDLRLGRHNNASYISGYEGSPLGGFDIELARAAHLFGRVGRVVHHPGVNEKLAMAGVYGSQFVGHVDGFWYGKAQGVKWIPDEGGLAAFSGTGDGSGAVILAGDDHQSKSSTFPGASDLMLEDMFCPTLFPASIDEIIHLGLTAVELSRYCGLYVGLKLLTPICDGAASVRLSPARQDIVVPAQAPSRLFRRAILGKSSLAVERELVEVRLEAAREFARHNRFNYIVDYRGQQKRRLGLVVAGKAYTDLLLSLCDIGCSPVGDPLRILKLGMTYPVEPNIVREFAQGLTEIIVIEEKRDFIESQVKSILYEHSSASVLGKEGREGEYLLPGYGEITPEIIIERLYPFFREYLPGERPFLEQRMAQIQDTLREEREAVVPPRVPTYCSGCPHSRSLRLPEGSRSGGDIGCHTMEIMKREMPGRGVEWISSMGTGGGVNNGVFPFEEDRHIFQNLGDGTYFHSGKLSVSSSVATGANITYRLLYNGVVAMTGGQNPQGQLTIENLVRELEAVGARKVVVVSDSKDLPRGLEVVPNSGYDALLVKMREIPGTTVVVFDRECATEKRRLLSRSGQKRTEFLVINEEVCEGCGDCGRSLCPSLHLPQTELGRKTRIHMPSCNDDLACLAGDCPAFMRVGAAGSVDNNLSWLQAEVAAQNLPAPAGATVPPGNYNIVVAGIGGTGVVSLSATLAHAAILDGGFVNELNMTGLAQKGGPVESQIILNLHEQPIINAIGYRSADLYIACDTIHGLAPENLRPLAPDRTRIIANVSLVPTIEMIVDRDFEIPEQVDMADSWRDLAAAGASTTLDAGELVEALMFNHMFVNILLLGVAYQKGTIPLTQRALEGAIQNNLRQPESNLLAFRLGRLWVHDQQLIEGFLARVRAQSAGNILDRSVARYGDQVRREFGDVRELFEQLDGFERRLSDLIDYQDVKLARRYAAFVKAAYNADPQPDKRWASAVARYHYKLLAYKDEFEVARLHLFRMHHASIMQVYGDESQVSVFLLPPLLRKMLGQKKICVPAGVAKRLFGFLVKLKGLRNTALDPFARTLMRRFDRALITWYETEIEECGAQLATMDYAEALALASLPERIRGYETVRLRSAWKHGNDRLHGIIQKLGLEHEARATKTWFGTAG